MQRKATNKLIIVSLFFFSYPRSENTPILMSKSGFIQIPHNKYPDFDLEYLVTIDTWEVETFCVLLSYMHHESHKVWAPLESIFRKQILLSPNKQYLKAICFRFQVGYSERTSVLVVAQNVHHSPIIWLDTFFQ